MPQTCTSYEGGCIAVQEEEREGCMQQYRTVEEKRVVEPLISCYVSQSTYNDARQHNATQRNATQRNARRSTYERKKKEIKRESE